MKISLFRKLKRLNRHTVRWLRSCYYRRLFQCADESLIVYGKIVVKAAENIIIGRNCRINDYVFLHGAGGIEIADDVTISAFSKILSVGYETSNWKEIYKSKLHKFDSVYIGQGAWICAGATILPGVKITGKGVIVASNAVLTRDINEDFALVAGNPARVVKIYK